MLFVIAATVLTAVVLASLGIEYTLQNGLEEASEKRSVLLESRSGSSYSDSEASEPSAGIEILPDSGVFQHPFCLAWIDLFYHSTAHLNHRRKQGVL